MLTAGMKAPDFTLIDDEGKPLTLSQLLGKKVVLYFYPKDDTSGCTTQACDFRDHLSDFENLNAVVIGVSRDDTTRHQKFKAKHQLNFKLLTDEDSAVCEQYGVWQQKSMYGRTYYGIERSTFLIDEKGCLEQIWRKVKVPDHYKLVLSSLK